MTIIAALAASLTGGFMGMSKYTPEQIQLIAALADLGYTRSATAALLEIPAGTVATLSRKHGIRFSGKMGRPRVDNPVRAFRPNQKQYYKGVGCDYLDRASQDLSRIIW